MIVVVKLSDGSENTHQLPHGGWEVLDNGTLHIQDANFVKRASYAAGRWAQVR